MSFFVVEDPDDTNRPCLDGAYQLFGHSLCIYQQDAKCWWSYWTSFKIICERFPASCFRAQCGSGGVETTAAVRWRGHRPFAVASSVCSTKLQNYIRACSATKLHPGPFASPLQSSWCIWGSLATIKIQNATKYMFPRTIMRTTSHHWPPWRPLLPCPLYWPTRLPSPTAPSPVVYHHT